VGKISSPGSGYANTSIKTQDPDPQIFETLDLDPYEIDADLKPWWLFLSSQAVLWIRSEKSKNDAMAWMFYS